MPMSAGSVIRKSVLLLHGLSVNQTHLTWQSEAHRTGGLMRCISCMGYMGYMSYNGYMSYMSYMSYNEVRLIEDEHEKDEDDL